MTSSTITPAALLLPPLYCCLAAIDELGLHATPGCSRGDRLLDELGRRLAVAQDGFDLGRTSGSTRMGKGGGRIG